MPPRTQSSFGLDVPQPKQPQFKHKPQCNPPSGPMPLRTQSSSGFDVPKPKRPHDKHKPQCKQQNGHMLPRTQISPKVHNAPPPYGFFSYSNN